MVGPDGLPAIASNLVIQGNGASIVRASGSPDFRLFCVLGGPTYGSTSAGSLTLEDLTLSGGLAQGGTSNYGGGGLGAGRAIFNVGVLNLYDVTADDNSAIGGSAGDVAIYSSGGAGIGSDATNDGGTGGFGGTFPGAMGGAGGSVPESGESDGEAGADSPRLVERAPAARREWRR